jgi:carboxymethylenebutenolidase
MLERRLTANDFHPEVMRLFDRYVHGLIDRRGFLDGAGRYATAGVTAAMLLEALNPKFAQAQQVKADDARLTAGYAEIPSPGGYGKVRGYLVRPKAATGKLPGVLVVHENRGLNPHIEDVARRLALANFAAFAPDALFPLGGYPGDEDKARTLFPQLDQAKTREDFVAAATWLRGQNDVSGRVGVVGFCYGGSISNLLATRLPWLSAAVPFYGSQPPVADVPKIKAAVLVHYAENDPRINEGAAAYEQAMKAAGVKYEAHVYAGTQHGFHNDTTPRFDEAAAKVAWQRTLTHFESHLRA